MDNVVFVASKCSGIICTSNQMEIKGDHLKNFSFRLKTSMVYELNIHNGGKQNQIELYGSLKRGGDVSCCSYAENGN